MRMHNIEAGQKTLAITYAGKTETIEIEVTENSTTLINFTAIGGYSSYQTIML